MLDEENFQPKQSGDKVKTKFVARTPMEAHRIKLEKLMSDPSKPVLIPTTKQKKDFSNAIPSFIRNVMGSSAGAGSGEFHVYRHLRRKEYARQKHIQQKSKRETLDDEYQQKLENNRLQSEDKTAKKRAKRLKKKKNAKNKAKMPKMDQTSDKSEGGSDDEDNEDDEDDSGTQANENEATNENENTATCTNEATNELTETTSPSTDAVKSDGDPEKNSGVEEEGDTLEAKELANVSGPSSVQEGVNE